MFVDHDPARLADRVDQRWQLAGSRVAVVPGVARQQPRTDSDRPAAGNGPAPQAATVEVTGLEAESLERLAGLVGVLGVAVEPAGAVEAQAGRVRDRYAARPLGLVRVTVSAAASDAVLRELLRWDGVHVSAVGLALEQPGSGRPRPGEVGGGTEASP